MQAQSEIQPLLRLSRAPQVHCPAKVIQEYPNPPGRTKVFCVSQNQGYSVPVVHATVRLVRESAHTADRSLPANVASNGQPAPEPCRPWKLRYSNHPYAKWQAQ